MQNNIYNIPASLPFATTLSEWILEKYGADPLTLSRVVVLLPSRRACRGLRDAFLRSSNGKPLLLPRIQPLGDVEEDVSFLLETATAPEWPVYGFEYKRLSILADLIKKYRERISGHKETLDNALHLARNLTKLLDELEREEISLENLGRLVPDEFSEHWQVTIEFLKILSEYLPQIAKDENLVSPQDIRGRKIKALAAHWQKHPPHYPVIIAGTTGSIPATAQLLKTVSMLPNGAVVLPALDMLADENYFGCIDESHPQWGMRELLKYLKIERLDVQPIGNALQMNVQERIKLLSELMRPVETSEYWQELNLDIKTALKNISLVECVHTEEEACVIALMLREVLETPQKTAALVTHDRELARRVAAIMHRFSVTIDDSAGIPLLQTPLLSFLRLIPEVALNASTMVPLLSLLKHPLAHAGMERIEALEAVRDLEKECLRGVQQHSGTAQFKRLLHVYKGDNPAVRQLLSNLEPMFEPWQVLTAETEIPLNRLLKVHIDCAEALAGITLWEGPEADRIKECLAELKAGCGEMPVTCQHYAAVLDTLLLGKVFRPEYGTHPRLKILSPLEARMQSFDRVILGGLNEGSWPADTITDPWFNRPMRAALGLPAPERDVGMAAHDFSILLGTPEIFFTRSQKVQGKPTTASRWLVKLDMLLHKFSARTILVDNRWREWAMQLDAPAQVVPCLPPEPKPPVSVRPTELSVTQVETWLRDPYSLYASHILKLRPLKTLAEEPTAADFGTLIHKAMEDFVKAWPADLPDEPYQALLEFGRAALQPLLWNAAVEALWWPRFKRIAKWVIEQEMARRHRIDCVTAEEKGSYTISNFTLNGRADRIEKNEDGIYTIIDYKTGSIPTINEIEMGIASQLVLLAWIFSRQKNTDAFSIEYWRLLGSKIAGECKTPVDEADIKLLKESAEKGLHELITQYANADFPYRATPVPAYAKRYNDYEHLARTKEWS